MVDWLAEGGQTVDMRTLWTSHVGLFANPRLAKLIATIDSNHGAAVYQGNVRGGVVWCGAHLHFSQMILSTHFEEYEKGEVFRDNMQSLFGTGVFNSDGPSPQLTLQSVSDRSRYTGERWK